VVTGDYGDNYFADEFTWAAAELYITTRNDDYLKHIPLANIKLTLPTWSNVNALGHYSLARNSNKLTPAAAKFIPEVNRAIIDFADGLLNNLKLSAYQTVMGTSAQDFSWGSNAVAANQGIALIQAYLLTRQVKYADAALGNLDYLLGRNGTGYCFITGFGSKSIMHPHHRPSIADGITDPVPGLLSGGPNPGRQDSIAVPSSLPNLAFVDDERAYAVNEIAINWNAPLAYLANAIEALQYDCGYIKK
ncbi:MAG: cellulase, partial [Sphingobacteriales bacterium]